MSNTAAIDGSTQLLRGTIRNYRRSRRNQDFMFTPEDRARMGTAAIGASLVGLGGIAVGLAGASLDTSETADLLEFDLDGKSIRAWVWQSVFKEGDQVDVVAEQMGDVWHGYGIRRPADRIVALHPHCSRGRYAHYKMAIKSWFKYVLPPVIIFIIFGLGCASFKYGDNVNWKGISTGLLLAGFGATAIYGIIVFQLARKFMGFVKLAEGIFAAFGWKDVKNIDLPALTKRTKQPGDSGVLGVLYFRY